MISKRLHEELLVAVGQIDPKAEAYLRDPINREAAYIIESSHLCGSFMWGQSRQGNDYWMSISSKLPVGMK